MTPFLSVESENSEDSGKILPAGQEKFRINK